MTETTKEDLKIKGGGNSPMKMTCLSEMFVVPFNQGIQFRNVPLKGTKIPFCGRGFEFIFTPKKNNYHGINFFQGKKNQFICVANTITVLIIFSDGSP